MHFHINKWTFINREPLIIDTMIYQFKTLNMVNSVTLVVLFLSSAFAYQLCNSEKYRYAGQSISVPIHQVVAGTYETPSKPITINGNVEIIDGCTVMIYYSY